jgi:hypothetical protein
MLIRDEERARALQTKLVIAYESLKYKSPTEQDAACIALLAAAFAAIREECAKVADTYAERMYEALRKKPDNIVATCKADAAESIADAIRTAQPAGKAQEKEICICGAPMGSKWCREKGHEDER